MKKRGHCRTIKVPTSKRPITSGGKWSLPGLDRFVTAPLISIGQDICRFTMVKTEMSPLKQRRPIPSHERPNRSDSTTSQHFLSASVPRHL